MKIQIIIYCALSLLISGFACTSTKVKSLKYIEIVKPSLSPQIFAPGHISKEEESEFGSVFSKDGTAFYYAVDIDGKAEIRYTRLNKQQWTQPITILSDKEYGYNDPFLSPDEQELFYISNRPINELDTLKDYDIWYSKKIGNQWSAPINAGTNINSDSNEYYISFTANGTMYFASNKDAAANRQHDYDIYSSARIAGEFQEAIKLGDSINTKRYEADVFVAPDESYLIFCSARKEGLGKGDLYISFKDDQGAWRKAKNMGEIINSPKHELCPFVTVDGQYFFYTSDQNIYWVSTGIFDQYK